jgi:hypothetical protein
LRWCITHTEGFCLGFPVASHHLITVNSIGVSPTFFCGWTWCITHTSFGVSPTENAGNPCLYWLWPFVTRARDFLTYKIFNVRNLTPPPLGATPRRLLRPSASARAIALPPGIPEAFGLYRRPRKRGPEVTPCRRSTPLLHQPWETKYWKNRSGMKETRPKTQVSTVSCLGRRAGKPARRPRPGKSPSRRPRCGHLDASAGRLWRMP